MRASVVEDRDSPATRSESLRNRLPDSDGIDFLRITSIIRENGRIRQSLQKNIRTLKPTRLCSILSSLTLQFVSFNYSSKPLKIFKTKKKKKKRKNSWRFSQVSRYSSERRNVRQTSSSRDRRIIVSENTFWRYFQ